MRNQRQDPRITDTQDLLASLRALGRSRSFARVINLSQGGMLVAETGLQVGEETAFELAGPGFRYAGVADVAHITNGATGLRFRSWQGQADRPMRSLIAKRGEASSDTRERHHSAVRRVAVLIGADRPAQRGPDRSWPPSTG
jgi:hypothetical protein